MVAALEAFTEQGNQLAQQLQAATLNSLRNSFQEVADPHSLLPGLDLGLPPGVTIGRLFQGMRGGSR